MSLEAGLIGVQALQQRSDFVDVGAHMQGGGMQTAQQSVRTADNGSIKSVIAKPLRSSLGNTDLMNLGEAVNDTNPSGDLRPPLESGKGGLFRGSAAYFLPLGMTAAIGYVISVAAKAYETSNYVL